MNAKFRIDNLGRLLKGKGLKGNDGLGRNLPDHLVID